MKLFDETRTSCVRHKRRTESIMEYLNSVTHLPFEQARERLEKLFQEYSPDPRKKQLLKDRLWRGGADSESAFYEMLPLARSANSLRYLRSSRSTP